LAKKDGKGAMVDWVYREGLTYLPPDEEVKRLRPAD
jgi:branched-chain amino acid transport system substrate-binding protein